MRPLKGQALALRDGQTGTLRMWSGPTDSSRAEGRRPTHRRRDDGGCRLRRHDHRRRHLALLEGVHRALPSSEEMEIEAIWSGFRPTTEDDAPILGDSDVPGLLIATGHHRNGILLAPVTAAAIEELVMAGAMTGAARPFGLDRFQAKERREPGSGVEP